MNNVPGASNTTANTVIGTTVLGQFADGGFQIWFSTVPEPGSFTLLAVGIGLAWLKLAGKNGAGDMKARRPEEGKGDLFPGIASWCTTRRVEIRDVGGSCRSDLLRGYPLGRHVRYKGAHNEYP